MTTEKYKYPEETMITKHLFEKRAFRRGIAAVGALLALSAAAYAADPSTFPAPTGDKNFVPAGAKAAFLVFSVTSLPHFFAVL